MNGKTFAVIRSYSIPVATSALIALFIESYYIRQDGVALQSLYGGIAFFYKLLGK